ncbi:HERC1, partial [Symbiodinium sp. CCMP2456]
MALPVVQSATNAFAVLQDGRVRTAGYGWGDDSSAVTAQLQDGVSEIAATPYAFAAIKTDGSVVAWGHPSLGGDCRSLPLLRRVRCLKSNQCAFAAIMMDGSLGAFGHAQWGGTSPVVDVAIQGRIKAIQATSSAFAAILANRSIVTWGRPDFGGDIEYLRHTLYDVVCLSATSNRFAALRSDKELICWGTVNSCWQIEDVVSVKSGQRFFLVVHSDGEVSLVP